jgi:dTDP-4-dehydrorhamnose 3,5-epimerase
MIEGVELTKLFQHFDSRGAVFKFLRSDSPTYKFFGESYFSIINEGVVKGWKFHKIAIQNFSVPFGKVKFVLYDNRIDSRTKGKIQEIIIDDCNEYFLLSLPANIWYSFKCESRSKAILANITNILHDPEESISLPINSNEIPYEWIK